jgi:hypothetical protein
MRTQNPLIIRRLPGTSRLFLTIEDESGRPIAARVALRNAAGRLLTEFSDHGHSICPGTRIDGAGSFRLRPGPVDMEIWNGFERVPLCSVFNIRQGEDIHARARLVRRIDMASRGWYGGDSHCHVLHGEKGGRLCTLAQAALAGRAEGLHYLQLAPHWDVSKTFYTVDTLRRKCRDLSTPDCLIGWNLEAPKAYLKTTGGSGNIGCYGHGYTVGLRDHGGKAQRFAKGPNYTIHRYIRQHGGICAYTHPARWWTERGRMISNLAQELPFDTVAGPTYDAVDVFADAPHLFWQTEQLWFTLLNMKYRIPGVASSDAALDTTGAYGFMRTYTQVPGRLTFRKLAAAIKAGRSFMTTGPLVFFSLDDYGLGDQLRADGTVRVATLQAFASPHPVDRLETVQILRNGEVVKAFDLSARPLREWQGSFEIMEHETCWYAVRVVCRTAQRPLPEKWGTALRHYALTNPIYFLKPGDSRPRPAKARVTLRLLDRTTGRETSAIVHVRDGERSLMSTRVKGRRVFTVPATADFLVERTGRRTLTRSVFICSGSERITRDMNTLDPSLYSPEIYRVIRERLQDVRITVSV